MTVSSSARFAKHFARLIVLALSVAMPAAFAQNSERLPAREAQPLCGECGFIEEIRPVTSDPQIPSPLNYDDLLPSATVLTVPLGRHRQSDESVELAGNPDLRDQYAETVYEVVVRFDDGHATSIDMSDISGLRVGDRVRVRANQIEPY